MTAYLRSFRLTCLPREIPAVEALLEAQGFRFEPDLFVPAARRLTAEPFALGSSLAAFFGLIYIQDRSSMLPPVALSPAAGAAVLDMCASPGSKTGQLAAAVGAGGFVLGNEPSPVRLATLRRNLVQMNFTQAATCCYAGEKIPLAAESFRYIQLDPPCSGWGTVERNPKVLDIWKDDKTLPLVRLQRELLREAVRILRPSGELVYSTCTTNVAENEEQVRFALEECGLELRLMEAAPGFVLDEPMLGMSGVWRLSPRLGEAQGFFVAHFVKPKSAEVPCLDAFLYKDKELGQPVPDSRLLEAGLDPAGLKGGQVAAFGESLHFVPSAARELAPTLRWQGMYMGKVNKSGELLIAPRVRADGPLPYMDFDGEDGIKALTGLLCGQSVSTGIAAKNVLLRWNGVNLGRARCKGGRLLWTER